jgi:hypothetical protein
VTPPLLTSPSSRIYWIAVAFLHAAVFYMVGEWALRTENALIFSWNAALAMVTYWAWEHRARTHAARVAMLAPVAVMFLTGLAGRWT